MIAVRRIRSPLLAHFALQMAVWGVVLAVIAAIDRRGLICAISREQRTWIACCG
jgi:hypothetical protein